MPTIGAGSKVTLKGTLLLLAALALPLVGCSSPAAPTQVFVDPLSGQDTHPGTQERPLKTLKKALEAAVGPVRTVVLLAGTYDGASGETWGYTVPDGITVKANSSGVILEGLQGKSALTMVGTAALNFVTLKGFDLALQASSGAPALTGVVFQDNRLALKLSGSVRATLTDVTFSGTAPLSPGVLGALELSDSAQATLNNPILKDTYPSRLRNQARLALNGGTASGLGSAVVLLGGTSSLVCQNFSAQNIPASQIILELRENASAELNKCTYQSASGAGSADLGYLSGSAQLKLQDVTAPGGLELNPGTRADISGGFLRKVFNSGTLNLTGTHLSQLVQIGGSATVTGSTISNFDSAAVYISGGQLKLRGSTVSGRSNTASANMGILVSNTVGVIAPDLGTAADPGGNNLSGGNGPGLEVNAPVQVSVVGNTWKAGVQGANASGQYASATVSGPTGNRTRDFNFYLLAGSSVRF